MRRLALAPAVLLLLLLQVGVEARQGATGSPGAGQAPPGGPGSDTVDLVFEREVFVYPTFQRRNPFAPLTGDEGGPRFEQLRLVGVLYSSDPRQSIAVLGVQGSGSGANAVRTYRVRTGESLGNARVVEIRPEQVVMSIDEFGVFETRILEVRRPDWSAREAAPPPDTVADTVRIISPSDVNRGGGDPSGDAREFGNGGSP